MPHIPHHSDLKQFKTQAKELLKAFLEQDSQAITQFNTHLENPPNPSQAKLSHAQQVLAKKYGFTHWNQMVKAIEALPHFRRLVQAFEKRDLANIKEILTQFPILIERKDILGRAVRHGDLSVVQTVYEMGVRGIQEALGYTVYKFDPEIGRFLINKGASFALFPALAGSEVLNSEIMTFALDELGGNISSEQATQSIAMLLSTYSRNPAEKHACLELLHLNGIELPETPIMALHRGRIDLLHRFISKDPSLLRRQFSLSEIYPTAYGIQPGDGLHLTPLEGATLLHIAVEYDEREIMKSLLEWGADVNARSGIDKEGFGGHTPLFHTVVSYTHRDKSKASYLLEQGANPHIRANVRKQLKYMGKQHLEQMYTFKDVNPITYAQQFQAQQWVSHVSLEVIHKHISPI